MKDMYKWYYGADYCPEKHDRKNAIAEMTVSLIGFGLFCLLWAVVLVLWFKGIV